VTQGVPRMQHSSCMPPLSVSTTGNHDTSALAAWWSEIRAADRDEYWSMVVGHPEKAPRFSPTVHRKILRNAYEAASSLVLIPFQDLFGTRERINVPGTVNRRNWTYRARWTVEQLRREKPLLKKTEGFREMAMATGRLSTA